MEYFDEHRHNIVVKGTTIWFFNGKVWLPGDEENYGLAMIRNFLRSKARDLPPNELPLSLSLGSFRKAEDVEKMTKADSVAMQSSRNVLFDSDPLLLGTPEGAIDLRTGELRAMRTDDYVTKLSSVAPSPDEDCPRWHQAVREFACGDEELASYLQRAAGYWITGSVKEEAVFFLYGDGGSGKGTLLQTLEHASASMQVRFRLRH